MGHITSAYMFSYDRLLSISDSESDRHRDSDTWVRCVAFSPLLPAPSTQGLERRVEGFAETGPEAGPPHPPRQAGVSADPPRTPKHENALIIKRPLDGHPH